MFSSWFEKVITNSTYLVTNLSLMQFMLQGVATMADMFAWQKWMHSVTYKHTDAIIIKYTNRELLFLLLADYIEKYSKIFCIITYASISFSALETNIYHNWTFSKYVIT